MTTMPVDVFLLGFTATGAALALEGAAPPAGLMNELKLAG